MSTIFLQEFEDYFKEYFSDMTGGDYVTDAWTDCLVSTSGIQMMITDLVMLGEGLAHNLNISDPYTVASGVAETDTRSLYNLMSQWNTNENTLYSNYLYGKLMTGILKEEPIIKLKVWYGLDQVHAETLWNLLNYYRDEEQNLDNAYARALDTFARDGSVFKPSSAGNF